MSEELKQRYINFCKLRHAETTVLQWQKSTH